MIGAQFVLQAWLAVAFFFPIHDAQYIVFHIADFIIFYRMYQVSDDLFWTNMVRGEEDIPGLENLNFSLTNETQ